MNKLIATLALGTTLAFMTVNGLAKEGQEHSGKTESSNSNSGSSGTNSGSSTSNSGSSHEQGETDEATETEDHTTTGTTLGTTPGTSGQEAENETETGGDDTPPVLPALTPIGTNVLLPAHTTTPQPGDLKTIY